MKYKDYGIVITGGGHGIGKGIIEEFVNEGAKVCFIDINEAYRKTLENDDVYFFLGDVSKQDDLDMFVSFCKNKLQRIDILINNACVSHKGILSDCHYEDFQHTLSIGVVAPYYLSQSFKNDLTKQKGSIINIASSRAFQSEPDTESYSSAKGGIVSLTHALSVSLSGNVRVNCIAPGWIDVHDTDSFSKEDMSAIPVGRVGTPKDIAKMVSFLCSDDASFITGETFIVDGGMNKRMIYHGDHGWEYHI
ncbi:MAG: SDR family oxidoreductase [Coprobacillus sp.]